MVARAQRKPRGGAGNSRATAKETEPATRHARRRAPIVALVGPALDSRATYGIWYATSPVLARHRSADQPAWPTSKKTKRRLQRGSPGMNDIPKGDSKRGAGRRSIHPGSGRRKAAPFPRGRVLREEEVAAVKALLGDQPRERALLIEYLHLIQDQRGLPAGGPPAGAGRRAQDPDGGGLRGRDLLRPLRRGRRRRGAAAEVTVRVCDSLSCVLAGAEGLLRTLQGEKLPGVRVVRAPCIGSCHTAPAAEVGHQHVDHATPAKLKELALRGDVHRRDAGLPGFRRLREGRRLRRAALLPRRARARWRT